MIRKVLIAVAVVGLVAAGTSTDVFSCDKHQSGAEPKAVAAVDTNGDTKADAKEGCAKTGAQAVANKSDSSEKPCCAKKATNVAKSAPKPAAKVAKSAAPAADSKSTEAAGASK